MDISYSSFFFWKGNRITASGFWEGNLEFYIADYRKNGTKGMKIMSLSEWIAGKMILYSKGRK